MSTHALKVLSVSMLAAALAMPASPAFAQHEGHAMPMPAPKPAPKKTAPKPAPKPAARPATEPAPAAVDHAAMGHGAVVPKPAAKPAAKPKQAPMDHAAMGHGTPAPKSAVKPVTRPSTKRAATSRQSKAKTAAAAQPPAVDHAAMGHGTPAADPASVDHAAMGHGSPATLAPTGVDHAAMGHSVPAATQPTETVDHAAMGHGTPPAAEAMDHSGMDHGAMDHGAMQGMDHAAMGDGADKDLPADATPRTPIPVLTDADRAAAFPDDAHGHEVHDQRVFSYWLVDRLEWQDTEEGSLGWEGLAWIGGDINRVWLRTEGEASDGEVESGNAEVLYGRSITAWWDAVAGVRQDFGKGPSRTYAAFGFQGLAPYKFEAEVTAFVGANGRGGATLEAEYDTLITNRLILQWQGETTFYAKDDPQIGVGSGLSKVEAGARLRYEFTKRFAPYVGVEFERAFGGTADFKREENEPTRDSRLVAGIRFWF